MTLNDRKVLAVFADAQNVNLFRHSTAILKFLDTLGETPCRYAYHYWRSILTKKQAKLLSDNWQCIDVPTIARNAVDQRLMEDFRNLCRFREPDMLVLITNDGDFSPMVRDYLQSGRQVIVIGCRGKVSHKLQRLLPQKVYFIENLNQPHSEAA